MKKIPGLQGNRPRPDSGLPVLNPGGKHRAAHHREKQNEGDGCQEAGMDLAG